MCACLFVQIVIDTSFPRVAEQPRQEPERSGGAGISAAVSLRRHARARIPLHWYSL